MLKYRLPKKWRVPVLVAVSVGFVCLVYYFVALPLFTHWLTSNIPGYSSVQHALQAEFPGHGIDISQSTYYGSAYPGGKQVVLTVQITGSDFLSGYQLSSAEGTLCQALGQNVHSYTQIYLDNVKQHQFLAFYYRDSQPTAVHC